MPQILDAQGQPFNTAALAAPQTSHTRQTISYMRPMNGNMTPDSVAVALAAADMGNLLEQHRLFSQMEDQDPHLLGEINKRKLALLDLEWSIAPPRNPSKAEEADAQWLQEVLADAVDPLEDLFLALMDGPGHGFAAVELAWRRDGGEWLPSFNPRPQEWFMLDSATRSQLLLRGDSFAGEPLWPMGWITHTHGKAKTGYLGRMGLYRALAWPFVAKTLGIDCFAEFVEIFGLPIIMGKYFSGAKEDDKASLLDAVTELGRSARAIMPAEMQMEIAKVTGGASGEPHLALVDWAERSMSKAILGQTMSAEGKSGGGLGSGLANLHKEVRQDIRNADARQVAGTLTRDLLYPLLALNRSGVPNMRRCPRFVFDTGSAEDLKLYADALPKLAQGGAMIPVSWVHEKLRIPQAVAGEAVFKGVTPNASAALAALSTSPVLPAPVPSAPQTPPPADALMAAAAPVWDGWVKQLQTLVDAATSTAQLQQILVQAYGGLDDAELVKLMAAALALAELKGMDDVATQAAATAAAGGSGA